MILLTLKLFYALLLPWMFGFAVISATKEAHKIPAGLKWGLAYGIGMGSLALWMFIFGVYNGTFRASTLSLPFLSIILAFLLGRCFKKSPFETGFKKAAQPQNSDVLTSPEKILSFIFWIYILYYITFVFWRSLHIPVFVWDGVATIAYKAKIFFYNKGLVPLRILPHPSYPLLVPLLKTWIALNLSQWDDQLIKFFFPFTFVAYLSVQYHFLKILTNKFWALLGTALLVSSNIFVFFATVSYRDFFLLYFNCTAIILLLLWNKERIAAYLFSAAFFSGITTFTKLEGSGYLFIHLTLLGILLIRDKTIPSREKLICGMKFLLPSGGILALFLTYKTLAQVPVTERIQFGFPWEHLDRIPAIFAKFGWNLFLTGNWNIIWLLLVFCLLQLKIKKASPETWSIIITLSLFFSLYFIIAWLTPNFIWLAGSKAYDALTRVILHFFPLSTILITLILHSKE
ncbi:MAG: hypothetical protein WC450_07775 [Candidatus Omnitrophota bacterium]|jgi:hypothetical protein